MARVPRVKPPVAETLFRDNWPRRRKWMSWVLIWAMTNAQIIICAAVLRWLTPFPPPQSDNGLLVQALLALLALIGSIIGAYVFGATWDDNDKRKHLADREDFNPYGPSEPQTAVVAVAPVPPAPADPASDPQNNPPLGFAS